MNLMILTYILGRGTHIWSDFKNIKESNVSIKPCVATRIVTLEQIEPVDESEIQKVIMKHA